MPCRRSSLTSKQHQSQQLLLHAIAAIKTSEAPLDENALEVGPFDVELFESAIYDLDSDSVLRRRPGQKVSEPQLRHHRSARWIGQRRRCLQFARRYSRRCHERWQDRYALFEGYRGPASADFV